MCMSKPKMPKATPGAAAAPPAPTPTAKVLNPSDPLKDRLPGYGGDNSSLLSKLRIPIR